MDELRVQGRSAGSVWGVATIAVLLFVGMVLFAGLFGSSEITAISASQ